ncbi:MAG: hypothetical protein HOP02_02855 [Methylococcaceae bacterium]|nr:hypothetical protein [Methylococcaceae bacterium]
MNLIAALFPEQSEDAAFFIGSTRPDKQRQLLARSRAYRVWTMSCRGHWGLRSKITVAQSFAACLGWDAQNKLWRACKVSWG